MPLYRLSLLWLLVITVPQVPKNTTDLVTTGLANPAHPSYTQVSNWKGWFVGLKIRLDIFPVWLGEPYFSILKKPFKWL